MAIFKVFQPIEHDGRKLKIGDEIELPTEEAEALLKLGVIEQVVTTKAIKLEPPKT